MNAFAPSPVGMPVFDAITRAKRSGWRGRRCNPVSPPQSWQYRVMSVRSSATSHWLIQST